METKNSQDLIKDLVHITNDRISGFEKVEGVVWEGYPDVKSEYDKLISKSKVMKNELINILQEDNITFDDSGTVGGALHGAWISIKNSFTTGNSVNSTLENVIFGEKSAIESYRNALDKGDFSEETRKILKDHLHDLETYHHQFEKMLEYRK
ncbi:conserved hypothetical protein [Chryseobacterium arachidis]|uniref:DUF2383 domain-containing protein n=1 Tax=Chryseobacterium arachidis TaxID=1416778 RepID=A0A1M5JW89_9FLAO|nr:DUF2383 domain-containing protein [Chryseobacterium arachidis]SHG44806.1 conserved hypothetical protein [Chryseobacterium arachidis]